MVVFARYLSRPLASSVAIALTTLVPFAAAAQTSPDRIDAIEQHIRQRRQTSAKLNRSVPVRKPRSVQLNSTV
jgi:hypothetical protein